MSDARVDELIRLIDAAPDADALPPESLSIDEAWRAIESAHPLVGARRPLWRRPEFTVGVAAAVVVIVVVAVGFLRQPSSEPDEPVSTPPATTAAPTTEPAPTTTPPETTAPTTAAPTTAPPTTVSDEEAAFLEIPTWGTSSGDGGIYRTFNFSPPFTFVTTDGWERLPNASEVVNGVTPMLAPGTSPQDQVGVSIYRHGAPALEGDESVEQLIERISEHPSVEVISAEQTTIGGRPATRLDYSMTDLMTYIQLNAGVFQPLEAGTRATSFIVDVDGETVSFLVFAADPTRFDSLIAQALPVIDSVTWFDASS